MMIYTHYDEDNEYNFNRTYDDYYDSMNNNKNNNKNNKKNIIIITIRVKVNKDNLQCNFHYCCVFFYIFSIDTFN